MNTRYRQLVSDCHVLSQMAQLCPENQGFHFCSFSLEDQAAIGSQMAMRPGHRERGQRNEGSRREGDAIGGKDRGKERVSSVGRRDG